MSPKTDKSDTNFLAVALVIFAILALVALVVFGILVLVNDNKTTTGETHPAVGPVPQSLAPSPEQASPTPTLGVTLDSTTKPETPTPSETPLNLGCVGLVIKVTQTAGLYYWCDPKPEHLILTLQPDDQIQILGRPPDGYSNWLYVRSIREGKEGFIDLGRVAWRASCYWLSLPIIESSATPCPAITAPNTIPTSQAPPSGDTDTPPTSDSPAPLPLQIVAIYYIDDANYTCESSYWTRPIYIEVTGGDGSYEYFIDGISYGTGGSFMELWVTGRLGDAKVVKVTVSDGQQTVAQDFYIPAPTCPKPPDL